MKPIFLTAILVLTTCSSSCELLFPKADEPKTELEKLPPITQTGKNTFGCLVNGKALVVSNTSKQTAIFQQGQLQLGATLDKNGDVESVSISLIDPLSENEILPFDANKYYAGYSLIIGNSICIYQYDGTFIGAIIFSKIDRINYIISGTFEFSTVTQGCDTIRITDGRFDMQYTP
jgi:hypothetical protein